MKKSARCKESSARSVRCRLMNIGYLPARCCAAHLFGEEVDNDRLGTVRKVIKDFPDKGTGALDRDFSGINGSSVLLPPYPVMRDPFPAANMMLATALLLLNATLRIFKLTEDRRF